MRRGTGGIAVAVVALLLGLLAATQIRAQEVYSRSLQLETPASLTTLIATISDRNNALRDEIFDLRLRVEQAQEAITTGKGSLTEAQRELGQLLVFASQTPVGGPGVAIAIDGDFDDKALSDLVNELRNAGAEAIGVNERRVGPRSYVGLGAGRAIMIDGAPVSGPWTVKAIGSPEVIFVAMTRTGGIIGQFELIYAHTRFLVSKQTAVDLPAYTPRP